MTGINYNNNNKFDIQLREAQKCENELGQRLLGAKIELKTEQHLWEKTGNIAIEYECRGKPSGIAVTEAQFWAHELRRENQTVVYIMTEVEALKRVCRKYYQEGKIISGGDDNASRLILIPLQEILLKL